MFDLYTNTLLSALKANSRYNEVIARKQEILDGVYYTENFTPDNILFIGFSPAILSCRAENISVSELSDSALNFLEDNKVKVTKIDNYSKYKKKFEYVVAFEEYFTFASSDEEQQKKIAEVCGLATKSVISTLRDYKNQDFKEREFSAPALVRSAKDSTIFLESHDWDFKDRTRWNSMVYEINRAQNTMTSYGPFERRTMFFKQLAKFSMDAGALNFFVHKNLMYKSLIKKNYEHVVSIQFE